MSAAVLEPPISKSDAIRALVLAYALDWPELVAEVGAAGPDLPRDVERVQAGITALRGAGADPVDIDCGDGAAPFRFLLAQAAARQGAHVRFHGTGRLAERPHAALFEALVAALAPAGLKLTPGAPWPVEVRGAGRAERAVFRASGAASSQFASSLVLAAVTLARRERRAWTVELEGPLTSSGYLALTLAWARRCGVPVIRRGTALMVEPGSHPLDVPDLPSDWSSLGYLLLVAWKTGARVRSVDPWRRHPDAAVLDHLEQVGLCIEPAGSGTVRVTGVARGGLRASAAASPDLIPTLAALACVLDGPSIFSGVGVLRGKESDRLEGIVALAAAAGAATRLDGDELTLCPSSATPAALTCSSRGDHRLAMAAATLAVLLQCPLRLDDRDCVAKSFPGFWRQLAGAASAK